MSRAPSMPKGLPREAQKAWRVIVPALEADGQLAPEDRVALEMLALSYAQAVQAQAILDRDGLLSEGSMGQTREHPAATTLRAAQAMVARYLDHLGVGPVARARAGLAEAQRPNVSQQIARRIGESPRRPYPVESEPWDE